MLKGVPGILARINLLKSALVFEAVECVRNRVQVVGRARGVVKPNRRAVGC